MAIGTGRGVANGIANHITSTADVSGFTQTARAAKTTEQSLHDFAKALALRQAARPVAALLKDVAGALLDAAKRAQEFDNQMRLVNTQAHLGQREFANLSAQVLTMKGTKQPLEEVTGSLFDLFSSLELADPVVPNAVAAMELLNKAADAGDAPVREVTRSVVAMINTYGLTANMETFSDLLDIQFQLVEKGVVTYGELARTIGDVLPPAVAFDQNLNTVAGTLAFATRALGNANKASISVARTFDLLSRSNVREKLAELGIQVVNAQGEFRQFGDIARDMVAAVSQMSKVEALDALSEAFGRGDVRARRLLNAIVSNGEGLQTLIEFTKESDGAMQRALGERQQSRAFRQAQAIAELGRQWTRFGQMIDKVIGVVQEFFVRGALRLISFFNALPGPVKTLTVGLAALGLAMTAAATAAALAAAAFFTFRSLIRLMGFETFTQLVTRATMAVQSLNVSLLTGTRIMATQTGLLVALRGLLVQVAGAALLLARQMLLFLFNPWVLAIAGAAVFLTWLIRSKTATQQLSGATNALVDANKRAKDAEKNLIAARVAQHMATRRTNKALKELSEARRNGATDARRIIELEAEVGKAIDNQRDKMKGLTDAIKEFNAAATGRKNKMAEFEDAVVGFGSATAKSLLGAAIGVSKTKDTFSDMARIVLPKLDELELSLHEVHVIASNIGSDEIRRAFLAIGSLVTGDFEDSVNFLNLMVAEIHRFKDAKPEEAMELLRLSLAHLIPRLGTSNEELTGVVSILQTLPPELRAVAFQMLNEFLPSAKVAFDGTVSKVDKTRQSFSDLAGDAMVFAGMTKEAFQDFQSETHASLTDTTSVLDALSKKQNLSGRAIVASFQQQRRALSAYANNWQVFLSKNPPQQLVAELQKMGLEGGHLVEGFARLSGSEMKKVRQAYRGMGDSASDVTDATMTLVQEIRNLINELRGIPNDIPVDINVRTNFTETGWARGVVGGDGRGGAAAEARRRGQEAAREQERRVVRQTPTVSQSVAADAERAKQAASDAKKAESELRREREAVAKSLRGIAFDLAGKVTVGKLSSVRENLDKLFETLNENSKFVPNSLIRKTRELRRESKELEAAWDRLKDRMDGIRDAVASGFEAFGSKALIDSFKDVAPTSAEITARLQEQADKAREFGESLAALSDQGFNNALILELAQRGPEALPFIEALAGTDPKQINELFAAIDKQRRQLEKAIIEDQLGPGLRKFRNKVDEFSDALKGLSKTVKGVIRKLDPNIDVSKLADGIITTRPMLGVFGEAGPEAVIPLSASKKRRRMELLRESGIIEELLGMPRFGNGAQFGEPIRSGEGGKREVHVHLEGSIRSPQELARELEWSRSTRGW